MGILGQAGEETWCDHVNGGGVAAKASVPASVTARVMGGWTWEFP